MTVKLGEKINPMFAGWCDSCGGPKKEDNAQRIRKIFADHGVTMLLCDGCLYVLFVQIKAALEK
jgi:hypothetical protein